MGVAAVALNLKAASSALHVVLLGGLVLRCATIAPLATAAPALRVAPGGAPKRVMVWMASPIVRGAIGSFEDLIADLTPHQASFTAVSYQYFGVCGAGSNDPTGGSMDCSLADAVGTPHLAHAHPPGVAVDLPWQLRRAFPGKELWPMISYGNPGNASVLNLLVDNLTATDAFIEDAVRAAHAQNATGYNFDIECFPGVIGTNPGDLSKNYRRFLQRFAEAMHAATPPLQVSYDGLPPDSHGVRHPIAPAAPMDRWISMATYTSNLTSFETTLANGLHLLGSRFGVGLCPDCWYPQIPSRAEVQALFRAIESHGNSAVRELDVWAVVYRDGGNGTWSNRTQVQRDAWTVFWVELEGWLSRADALQHSH